MLHDDAPCNPQRPSEPIHIRPAQTQGLADPEPERHAQQSRRADRFIQVSDELTELIFRQRTWFPSLHCTLDGYQLHRIPLCQHVSPPHCELPQLMNYASNVNTALWRQLQGPEPQFHRARLQLSN